MAIHKTQPAYKMEGKSEHQGQQQKALRYDSLKECFYDNLLVSTKIVQMNRSAIYKELKISNTTSAKYSTDKKKTYSTRPILKTSAKSVQTTRVVCTNFSRSLYRLQLKFADRCA